MSTNQTAPDGYPPRPWVVVLVVAVSTFLGAMGISAVTLTLPELGRVMHLTIQQTSWVMLGFLLTASVFMLIAGRLGDLLGLKRVYLAGFLVVGLSTLVCGLAANFPTLVIARGAHGLGGAMVMATGPALLTTSFPPSQRGTVLGTVATATYAGLTVGPTLGGVIVSFLGWRWVFLINVPVAAIVLVLGGLYLPRSTFVSKRRFDAVGAALLVVGLPLVLLPLSLAGRAGWLPWMTWTLAAGIVAMTAFVAAQRRVASPLLELHLFRSGTFTGAVISALFNYVALFVVIILLPYFLEEGRGLTSATAGLFLSAQPLLMALIASPAGRLSDRIGTRGLTIAGMLVMAAGIVVLSVLGKTTPLPWVVVGLAVTGLGTGIFISPNSSALMGAARRDQQGVAAAVLAVSRNLGMMLGTAVAAGAFGLAGGTTSRAWTDAEFHALRVTLLVAAGAAVLAAVSAGLRADQRAATAPAAARSQRERLN